MVLKLLLVTVGWWFMIIIIITFSFSAVVVGGGRRPLQVGLGERFSGDIEAEHSAPIRVDLARAGKGKGHLRQSLKPMSMLLVALALDQHLLRTAGPGHQGHQAGPTMP